MYACNAPTIDDENQIIAAHLGPSVTTEPARPASKKPGLHNPTTKPSHQCIVFNRRRSSTAISAMGFLRGACREAAILPNGVAACRARRNNPTVNVPILVNCQCGHTTSASAGEEVSCSCGRQYATELSTQQVAALHAMNQQMRVFARLGVGLTGLLSILAFTLVGVYTGVAAFALGVVGGWVIL